MRQNNNIDNCQDLLKFSPEELRLCKEAKEESEFYSKRPNFECPGFNKTHRNGQQKVRPRNIWPGMMCRLEKSVPYGVLCHHELCEDESKFMLDHSHKRHHRLRGIAKVNRV